AARRPRDVHETTCPAQHFVLGPLLRFVPRERDLTNAIRDARAQRLAQDIGSGAPILDFRLNGVSGGLFVEDVAGVCVVSAHLHARALVREVGANLPREELIALNEGQLRSASSAARFEEKLVVLDPNLRANEARALSQESQVALVPLLDDVVRRAACVA